MKSIIVSQYLSSLKEDSELDYIFPLLLMSMDFKIITTPKEYKGYSQYGKDIIASGVDPIDGTKKLFYFELKGGQDKDITSDTFSKSDGIRVSLYEAKDSKFEDPSLLDTIVLSRKIVLVHNGIIKPDVKSTFDGFIKDNFKQKKQNLLDRIFGVIQKDKNIEFERWDINRLTQLFEEYLFNEYILTDEEALRYFKGFLSLFCTPEYDNSHFYSLVNHLLPNEGTPHKNPASRATRQLFETLKIISFIIINISRDNENLLQAIRLLHFLVLKLWAEILLKKWEKEKSILSQFEKVYELFKAIISEFYEKTINVAKLKKGLYYDAGGRFGIVGSPLLTFEYLSILYLHFCYTEDKNEILINIISVINENPSSKRPILDAHSIPITKILLAMKEYGHIEEAKEYLTQIIDNLSLWKNQTGLIPEGRNNIFNVVEYYALGYKPSLYECKTSQLIGCMFELMINLNLKDLYEKYQPLFLDIDLCAFVPFSESEYSNYLEGEYQTEINLFQRGLYNEGYQSGIILDDDFETFKSKTEGKNEMKIELRTMQSNYKELVYLAQYGNSTPIFPSQWRNQIDIGNDM